MELALALPDEMVEAFKRTGATELAEQVDREVMKRADELHGATLDRLIDLLTPARLLMGASDCRLAAYVSLSTFSTS